MSEWEQWVGRSTEASAFLDPLQANRMAVTLDREPGFAAGDPLPLAWHWLYFPGLHRASELGSDGHPRPGLVLPQTGLPRRMWAAGTLEFAVPLRLGSEASLLSTITSVEPKQGRTGTLVFVTVEHCVRSSGQECVKEVQSIVYRDAVAPAPPADSGRARTDAEQSRTWHVDSTVLFRYSALTFNSHRIHYDADYARDVEGYPGLVVHGPLVATLLLDLAAQCGPVRRFEYRAVSPLIAPAGFSVNSSPDGEGESALWAASQEGRVTMQARAYA